MFKQVKGYKKLLAEKEEFILNQNIDSQIKPIWDKLQDLRQFILEVKQTEQEHISLLIESQRFSLIQLCKVYIKQGFMSQEQYDKLSEDYKIYHALGGNGQAKEYYELAIELPIKSE